MLIAQGLLPTLNAYLQVTNTCTVFLYKTHLTKGIQINLKSDKLYLKGIVCCIIVAALMIGQTIIYVISEDVEITKIALSMFYIGFYFPHTLMTWVLFSRRLEVSKLFNASVEFEKRHNGKQLQAFIRYMYAFYVFQFCLSSNLMDSQVGTVRCRNQTKIIHYFSSKYARSCLIGSFLAFVLLTLLPRIYRISPASRMRLQ